MKIKQLLFRIWLGLAVIYSTLGLVYDGPGIALKFQTGSSIRWIHLGLAVAVAITVPLATLLIGRTCIWIAEQLYTGRSN
jgi:hypothetical protein